MAKSRKKRSKAKAKPAQETASQVADSMESVQSVNKQEPAAEQAPQNAEQPQVKYTNSGGLANFLHGIKTGIVFSSYQSNLMYFLGSWPNQLNVHQTAIDKPMGLYVKDKDTFYLSSGFGIYTYRNVLHEGQFLNGKFDGCYLPRQFHHTGILDAHDIGVTDNNEIVFVNTQYNCIATPCDRHSFKPYWMPPFITQLVNEDRCHLNGMAIDNGKVKYVTAVSKSNTIDGWRDRRANGGIVIDVEKNKIVCEGLSMPHSPRVHNGKLWVLNSGLGSLGYIEFDKKSNGKFIEVAFCPGFVRGVAFYENFAIVGLSKPRYERFEGLALDERLKQADSEPWCGIQIIDLNTGACVQWFRIDGAVAELYDVNVINNINMPMAMAPGSIDANTLITIDPELIEAQNSSASQ